MALVAPVFLDTSVLLAGSIDFGDASVHPMRIMDAMVRDSARCRTAWHCCLEFYANHAPPSGPVCLPATRMILADLIRVSCRTASGRPSNRVFEEAAGERPGKCYDARQPKSRGIRVFIRS